MPSRRASRSISTTSEPSKFSPWSTNEAIVPGARVLPPPMYASLIRAKVSLHCAPLACIYRDGSPCSLHYVGFACRFDCALELHRGRRMAHSALLGDARHDFAQARTPARERAWQVLAAQAAPTALQCSSAAMTLQCQAWSAKTWCA